MVRWIEMKLGMEIGLGTGHIDPAAPPPKGPKGHSPQFSAYICCGQTAGWIKVPLGTELGFGPGDIVLDGDPLGVSYCVWSLDDTMNERSVCLLPSAPLLPALAQPSQ